MTKLDMGHVPSSSHNSVTVINEAVINNTKKVTKSTTAILKSDKNKNAKVAKTTAEKAKTDAVDPVVANFTVDGWPMSKSRMAPHYIHYEDDATAILVPKEPYSSSIAGNFILLDRVF